MVLLLLLLSYTFFLLRANEKKTLLAYYSTSSRQCFSIVSRQEIANLLIVNNNVISPSDAERVPRGVDLEFQAPKFKEQQTI